MDSWVCPNDRQLALRAKYVTALVWFHSPWSLYTLAVRLYCHCVKHFRWINIVADVICSNSAWAWLLCTWMDFQSDQTTHGLRWHHVSTVCPCVQVFTRPGSTISVRALSAGHRRTSTTSPLCPSWSAIDGLGIDWHKLWRTIVRLCFCSCHVEQSAWFTQRHCTVTTLSSEFSRY